LCISVLVAAFACDVANDAPSTRDSGSDDGHDAAVSSKPYQAPVVHFPDPKSTEKFLLSETGLYRDMESKELAPDLIEFEPAYKLWSDGAQKRRWLRLPPGTKIDTSDMDHWVFPIGTMFFKEFALDGKRLETRLVARLGPEPEDFFMGAFRWNDDETDAEFLRDGESDVRGTDHDVPETKRCFTCHNGERGRTLGYSAVQQSAPKAPLSDPPDEPYVVPGNDLAREALGYLHANCGNCHNPAGTSRTDTKLTLRLEVSEHTVEDTSIYRSAVAVPLDYWLHKGFDLRIAPGDPDRSAILARMASRKKDTAMPPFASEKTDEDGLGLVRRWISSLQTASP
jgi:hypothetical protein